MSVTTITTLIGCFVMFGSWALVRRRSKKSPSGISKQIQLLQSFFFLMGLFCALLCAPQVVLTFDAPDFPLAMAWGYVIGHVFLYIGLINMLRLTFSMLPRLADKQIYVVVIGTLASLFITLVTIKTMVFGVLPHYDMERYVTLLNVHPLVGASIGVFAMVSVFPAAILMIINGVHNRVSRLRSFLLGSGLLMIMTAGPLHDVARTWQFYMVADVVSIIGFLILAGGVLYRFEEHIAPNSDTTTAPSPPPQI